MRPGDTTSMVTGESDPERAAIAFRAVKRARNMESTLTAFCRAIARDETMRVQISTGGTRTDGKIVYLKPPMALGYVVDHNRLLCGKRNDIGKQMCLACSQMDEVFSLMFHEMAHKVFDSFASINDKDRAELLARAVTERPALAGTRHAKIRSRIESIAKISDTSYPMICSFISPFLHPMVNALEDARVNRAMYNARSGTYDMFRAISLDVFQNGIEQPDGSRLVWSEAPDNSQVIVGLYCKASNFDYADWFKPAVVEALNDPQLTRMVRALDNARSIGAVYRASFPILERLRELGFCKRPDDLEDDPPPPKPEPSEKPEPGESRDSDDESESDDKDGSGASSTDDDEETDDDDSDDDTSDQDDTEAPEPGEDDASGGSMTAESDDNDDSPDPTDATDDTGSSTPETDDADETSDDDESDGSGTDADSDDEADDDPDYDPFAGDDDDLDTDEEEADLGSPVDATELLEKFNGHAAEPYDPDTARDDAEIDRAVLQADNFEAPSTTIFGVRLTPYDPAAVQVGMWERSQNWGGTRRGAPAVESVMPSERLINGTLQKVRIAFSDNKKARRQNGHRSGRVVSQMLPQVMVGNDKVFSRTRKPGKRDYFVCVTLDVSGSTVNSGRIEMIREVGMALGELFNRAGIVFSMYAHSGTPHPGSRGLLDLDIYTIKDRTDQWDARAKEACAALVPYSSNLDGHTLEFMRRRLDESSATDRMVLYVTDGAMPAENYDDELAVLQRELKTCKRKGYEVVGVGIQNDEPSKYGLDTVELNSVEDLPRLIADIERRLAVKS